jgi:hypothetical protein
MSFDEFKHQLLHNSLSLRLYEKELLLYSVNKSLRLVIARDPAGIRTQDLILPLDYIKTMPEKVLAMLQSKLGLNKTIFARSCEIRKIDRRMAEDFLSLYHLMGFTQSAFNYGLFYKDELVAVAVFSKGRKMNRLAEEQRSFELIRFCCKSGLTITGGLTRLVKTFAIEKKAGDIMTYVDKQLSNGQSFLRAGFKKQGESTAVDFLIDKRTYERRYNTGQAFDAKQFYKTRNLGNLKLIYTPGE